MSFCAIKWSYTSPDVLSAGLSRSDLAVLRTLCWFYNDKDTTSRDLNCFPSVQKIAHATGLKKSAVNNAKTRLYEKGLLFWQRSANFDDDEKNTNNYSINCPTLLKLLKENAERLKAKRETPDDFEDDQVHPLRPGLLYTRPDPSSLAAAFPQPLTAGEAMWMADALAFVLDRPAHRSSLIAQASDLALRIAKQSLPAKRTKGGRRSRLARGPSRRHLPRRSSDCE